MADELDQSRYKEATLYEERIRELKYAVGRNYLELGRALKEVRDNKYYIELGYETVTDWLKSPEISLSASWSWNLISMYELFVIKHQIPDEQIVAIDYNKLQNIVPVVRQNPDEIDEWLNKAKTLTVIDLKRELKEHQVIEKRKRFVLPETLSKTLILGDALVELPKIESESVDAVITDPPHFIPKHERRQNDDGEEAVDYGWIVDFHLTWLTEAKRILKPNGVLFVMADKHSLFPVGHAMRDIGLYLIRDIIWFKPNVNRPVAIENLVPSHETIIWSRKGGEHICNLVDVTKDVWEIQDKTQYGHPSEKPEFLLEQIIEIGTDPGQMILDPFAGSGTTLAVAKRMKRQFIGIEKDQSWYQTCAERLQDDV